MPYHRDHSWHPLRCLGIWSQRRKTEGAADFAAGVEHVESTSRNKIVITKPMVFNNTVSILSQFFFEGRRAENICSTL